MACFDWAGGIGTASRVVGDHTVGVLLLVNFGEWEELRIAGRHVGPAVGPAPSHGSEGSCACIVATDAPLLPQQLERLARRVFLGLARTGSYASNGSGEVAVAFSTANREPLRRDRRDATVSIEMVRNDHLNGLFAACVEAGEEAVLNALLGARTITGAVGALHAFDVARWRAAIAQ
jgi:D-aminopeptidase